MPLEVLGRHNFDVSKNKKEPEYFVIIFDVPFNVTSIFRYNT